MLSMGHTSQPWHGLALLEMQSRPSAADPEPVLGLLQCEAFASQCFPVLSYGKVLMLDDFLFGGMHAGWACDIWIWFPGE